MTHFLIFGQKILPMWLGTKFHLKNTMRYIEVSFKQKQMQDVISKLLFEKMNAIRYIKVTF